MARTTRHGSERRGACLTHQAHFTRVATSHTSCIVGFTEICPGSDRARKSAKCRRMAGSRVQGRRLCSSRGPRRTGAAPPGFKESELRRGQLPGDRQRSGRHIACCYRPVQLMISGSTTR